MGLVAILERPEHVTVYADHPAHLEYALHPFICIIARLLTLIEHYNLGFISFERSFAMIPWRLTWKFPSILRVGNTIKLATARLLEANKLDSR